MITTIHPALKLTFAITMLLFCGQVNGETFYYFDMENCKNYSISNEPDANSAIYTDYKNKFNELNHDPDWDVYEWHNRRTSNLNEKYPKIGKMHKTMVFIGGLNHTNEIAWEKQSLNDFPLAGTVYRRVHNKRGDLLHYKCVTNCSASIPSILYFTGYEPEEGDPSLIELQKASNKFAKRCKRR